MLCGIVSFKRTTFSNKVSVFKFESLIINPFSSYKFKKAYLIQRTTFVVITDFAAVLYDWVCGTTDFEFCIGFSKYKMERIKW